jgi:signal transduction histidine kinase
VPQIFRWIRHLKSYDGGISLTLTTDPGRLVIIARGVRVSRTLDPIQVVAGLRVVQISHDEIHLHAPLLGVTAVPMQHVKTQKAPVAEQQSMRWRLWTQPPSISIKLILYIGVVSAPAFHLVRGDAMASEGPALTLLSVVLPALIAIPLTRVRIRQGTRQGAFRVVSMWLFLAIASAILSNAVIALMAPRYQLPIGSGLRVFGAVMRYAVVGLSFTVTRGFLVQSGIDTAALNERKVATEDTRLEVLGNADATDRYLAEALHRTVQGRLAAISLLLRLDRREEAVAELQSLVSKTLPDIEIRLGQWTRNEISELAITVIQVPGLDISNEADWSTLGASQAELGAQLRRVVNEMAVNAVRHGAATDMRVQLIKDGPIVTLLCTDNGQGPGETQGSGLGSALLNEICSNYAGSWSLYRENESTIVRLVLTVADFEPQSA